MPLPRTDLAHELFEQHRPQGLYADSTAAGRISIHRRRIADSATAALLGRPIGTYITAELPDLSSSAPLQRSEVAALAAELAALLPKDGLVLALGLGNRGITPDALGPRTIDQLLATRHLGSHPHLPDLRPVAALAPGVLAQTGLESLEVITALVHMLAPACVVVVDALAARSLARLGRTVQIADSGIRPGSGVQNRRAEISSVTLGVPVISLGIPTVVDADTLLEQAGQAGQVDSGHPAGTSYMLAPRDIDQLIEHGARLLSQVLNSCLQPGLTLDEINFLSS